jgi:hypothetical protein
VIWLREAANSEESEDEDSLTSPEKPLILETEIIEDPDPP